MESSNSNFGSSHQNDQIKPKQNDCINDEESKEEEKFVRLSKAEKKAIRLEARKEFWAQHRKEERQTKKRKRKELIQSIVKSGADPREVMATEYEINRLKRRKLEEIEFCKQRVVLDLEFDEQMQEKDLKSLLVQIGYCYSKTRKMQKPFQLHLTGLSANSEQMLKRDFRMDNWIGIHYHNQPYLPLFDKEKLVYLTSESDFVLDKLNEEDIYIIGGLVDHNRLKGFCHKKATDQGIRTARIPIEQYMKLKTRKVLTVNQVYEILATYQETGDWTIALESFIPKRKGGAILELSSTDTQNIQESEGRLKDGEVGNSEDAES